MIKLPSELTISYVDAYQEEVISLINTENTITIDDSDVSRIDTIGVQFLLVVVNYILAQDKQIRWNSTSSILRESFKQLGINDDILSKYNSD